MSYPYMQKAHWKRVRSNKKTFEQTKVGDIVRGECQNDGENNKPFLVGPTLFDQERLICLDTVKYR